MPQFDRSEGVTIHYETYGDGFPLLLLAPGGMRSSIRFWERSPFSPLREFANEFRVIAMDQRNAGDSRAPISGSDGWHVYADDQLALLDHLGIARCHVLGGCIGGAFSLALMQRAPERISAGVIQQTIGLSPDNRSVFFQLFDDWSKELKAAHSGVTEEAWLSFREHMYGGSFVFAASEAEVRELRQPLLVLMGNDVYHPSAISREVAQLARNARLIERWKDADIVAETVREVRGFLRQNTPSV